MNEYLQIDGIFRETSKSCIILRYELPSMNTSDTQDVRRGTMIMAVEQRTYDIADNSTNAFPASTITNAMNKIPNISNSTCHRTHPADMLQAGIVQKNDRTKAA
eukprot:3991531-Amphidinium_carterae.1